MTAFNSDWHHKALLTFIYIKGILEK